MPHAPHGWSFPAARLQPILSMPAIDGPNEKRSSVEKQINQRAGSQADKGSGRPLKKSYSGGRKKPTCNSFASIPREKLNVKTGGGQINEASSLSISLFFFFSY